MVNGILAQVKLTALPGDTREHSFSGRLQPGVIIAADEGNAMQPSFHQGLQELAPVDLGLGGRHLDTQDAPAAVRENPDSRQDRGIDDLVIQSDALIAGIQDQVGHPVQ
jgi:hypothetical protein